MQVLQEKKSNWFSGRALSTWQNRFSGIPPVVSCWHKSGFAGVIRHDDATAEIFPCLGIAPVICDTHGEEDGWEELQALIALEKDKTIGYGIVSGTAIKVYPTEKLKPSAARFISMQKSKEKWKG